MKTLKITLVALSLLFSNVVVKADGTKAEEKLTMKYAVSTYVDAVCHGKTTGLSDLINDDAKFTNTRGKQIITHTKNDILKSFNNLSGVEQNCQVKSTLVESTPDQVIIKVLMKYEGFEKTDFVTMGLTEKGWKITNVASSYN